jgi:hypothetical protein
MIPPLKPHRKKTAWIVPGFVPFISASSINVLLGPVKNGVCALLTYSSALIYA